MTDIDIINRPPHYNQHPEGIECIQVTEWMPFNLGNAVKYLWRAGYKGATDEDLSKAIWFIERERKRRRMMAEMEDKKGESE